MFIVAVADGRGIRYAMLPENKTCRNELPAASRQAQAQAACPYAAWREAFFAARAGAQALPAMLLGAMQAETRGITRVCSP